MTERLIDAALRFAQAGLATIDDRITRLEIEGWQPMTANEAALFVKNARDQLFECDAIEDTLANIIRKRSQDELVLARTNDAMTKLSEARERLGMLIAIMRIGRLSGHALVDLAA